MNGFWLLCVMVVLSSCTHTRVKQETGLTPAGFWKDQALRQKETERLSAKLKMTFNGRKRSVSGRGRMILQEPRHVRLELRDPFGRLHYQVGLSGDRFVAHYPRHRVAYLDGASGNLYVSRVLGVDFTFTQLQEILLGRLRGGEKTFTSWEWDGNGGGYIAKFPLGEYKATALVDGQKGIMRKLELEGPEGLVSVNYSLFEPCCRSESSLWLARVVEIRLEKAGTSFEVEWEGLTPFKAPRPESVFRVGLTKKDKQIKLGGG